jgi:hypothetical protein
LENNRSYNPTINHSRTRSNADRRSVNAIASEAKHSITKAKHLTLSQQIKFPHTKRKHPTHATNKSQKANKVRPSKAISKKILKPDPSHQKQPYNKKQNMSSKK